MLPEEIDRLAQAVNALRPDWSARDLKTFIANQLPDRGYLAAAKAFAEIATDPTTRSPARILQPGPWWGDKPQEAAPEATARSVDVARPGRVTTRLSPRWRPKCGIRSRPTPSMRRNCAAKTEEEQHDPASPNPCLPRLRRAAPSRPRPLHHLQTEGRHMTRNTAQTDKTGPETSAQADPAYEDAEVSERRAGSRTEPHGATAILRLIAHGRGCECGLCTAQEATK